MHFTHHHFDLLRGWPNHQNTDSNCLWSHTQNLWNHTIGYKSDMISFSVESEEFVPNFSAWVLSWASLPPNPVIEWLFRSIAGVFGEGHATNRTSPCATSMVGQRWFIVWLKGKFYTCQVQPYASVVCSVVPTSPLDEVKGLWRIAMLGHCQYQFHSIHVWYIYIYHIIQEFCEIYHRPMEFVWEWSCQWNLTLHIPMVVNHLPICLFPGGGFSTQEGMWRDISFWDTPVYIYLSININVYVNILYTYIAINIYIVYISY